MIPLLVVGARRALEAIVDGRGVLAFSGEFALFDNIGTTNTLIIKIK